MAIKVPPPKVLHKDAKSTVTFTYAQDLEAKLNNFYGIGGPLQKFVDQEFMNEIQDYMPKDTGALIEGMKEYTTIGDGVNITKAVYAWYVYYGNEFNFQGAPRRGAFWDERWSADNHDAFIDKIQNFVDKR